MRATALASGSNGNAILVETPDVRLLFDAGASGRLLEARARSRGCSLRGIDAILVTHGHSDHIAGVGVLARRFGLPVHASPTAWRRIDGRAGHIRERSSFHPGERLQFGGTIIESILTPHDFPQSSAFVVESRGRRLGVLTDLGHLFGRLFDVFATLDAAILESNHDTAMLAAGPYPASLQDRIAGPGGHLSNDECSTLIREAGGTRLRAVVLAHLSGNCNTPALVQATAGALAARGIAAHVATREAASPWIEL